MINGNVSDKLFTGSLIVDDDNLNLNFDGLINYSNDLVEYDFNANIKKANLTEIQLSKVRDQSVFGNINAKLIGENFQSMIGDLSFTDFILTDLNDEYKFDNLTIQSRINNEKSIIIELISGKSNLDTLLAKLGELGKKNNIEFVSIVPKKIISFVDNKAEKDINKSKNKNLSNVVIDPLLVEGTKKFVIDVSLKTDFISLLSFLRELEFQENVILLDDFNLKLAVKDSNNFNIDMPQEMLEVKFLMTFYGNV